MANTKELCEKVVKRLLELPVNFWQATKYDYVYMMMLHNIDFTLSAAGHVITLNVEAGRIFINSPSVPALEELYKTIRTYIESKKITDANSKEKYLTDLLQKINQPIANT